MEYETARGQTFEEMQQDFRTTGLWRRGDARLVWVNEGDLIMSQIATKDEWRDASMRLCNALDSILYEDSDKSEQARLTDRIIAAEVLHLVRSKLLPASPQRQTEEAEGVGEGPQDEAPA